jgi:hypothetical protein
LLLCSYLEIIGNATSTSSTKHQLQSSPGSNEETIGCAKRPACLRAWRFFESSQHPMWPQVRHSRKCTHVSPVARHSTQPSPEGVTCLTLSRCVHPAWTLRIATLPLADIAARRLNH